MKAVDPNVSFPNLEAEVLEFWRSEKIFERSMEEFIGDSADSNRVKRKAYVFYDGPPFATGLPHYGHLLAGTIKDVVGRFFTMKGFQVDRRFGWDCHGLPVEFEVQKTLGLQGAKEIRNFGIGNFNEECRKIVLRYTKEWESFVERSGRWVDFTRQYRTMDPEFMETIWWVVNRLWDRGLLYEGVKCVPYSWVINTPLSNFEANLNYKSVQDPAITVRCQIKAESCSKLSLSSALPLYAYIWTTTPWTVPSNLAIAVHPELNYSIVDVEGQELVLIAESRQEALFSHLGKTVTVLKQVKGAELDGMQYVPPFSYFEKYREKNAFRIYAADFVSDSEGTGLVHCASFGEEDLTVFVAHNIPVVDPVDEEGNFTAEVSDFATLNVKAADHKIIAHLKESGALVEHRTIEHSYPFCWRTDKPLIYKSISTWFVAVEKIRDELQQMNKIIHWVPEHIKDGRFGKWLEGARDWAISRNRFWGTPIPIWRCSATGKTECIGSIKELEEKSGVKVTDLHSHYIDQITYPSSFQAGAVMKRIPEVLDCWFESGSMPYAQAHYPFEGKEKFEANFPADFIAEGLDQTRGWFYTLLVLSTALFGRPAFKNVIVNGIVLAEDGKKMSKSLKNYPPPDEMMNEYGADAMRLYLLSSAASRGEELRFSKTGVRDVVRQTLLPLWNAYNFFVTYALVDGWTPERAPKTPSTNLLDKWLMSKVASLIKGVDQAVSTYHLAAATQPILDFVDQLTNWYIRLNRRRFWSGTSGSELEDKLQAYNTLYTALLNFVRVLAPLAPFITDQIYRNLSSKEDSSVHLASYPTLAELGGVEIHPELEAAMELFEEVILLGRSIRNDHNLKVRQPLSKITIIHPSVQVCEGIAQLSSYIADELNVKTVEFSTAEEGFVNLSAQLNTKILGKVLGPKLGAEGMKALRTAVESLSTKEIRLLESGQTLNLCGEEIKLADIIIKRAANVEHEQEKGAKEGGSEISASSGEITVILDTTLNQALRMEGFAREFVNRVQKLRKDFSFEVTDRISIRYLTACGKLPVAVEEHKDYVTSETLAVEIMAAQTEQEIRSQGFEVSPQEIDGKMVVFALKRVTQV
jgi:isoleucyl-tRNA synthetase